MKPETVFLDELNANSKGYKVRVKVIEKGRARTSLKKGIVYQSLLLQDGKGNKMQGALFGDQVEGYKDAFVYNGEYEISNAPIKPCDEKWKVSQDDMDYQMNFGRQTAIQPINIEGGPVVPNFQCIANIPRVGDPNEKFDVLGIVLYVEETARKIVTSVGRELLVREIVITDHSSTQPLIISAWNDLTGNQCDELSSWAEKFNVVAFTALKVTSHKGFSLSTTMSTTITCGPIGERATTLEVWASKHQNALSDRQARVLEIRDPTTRNDVITIGVLRLKTVHDTLQEERHWLTVTVPNAELDRVNAYLGCSNCGKKTGVPACGKFACENCLKKDCISSPRVTFNCEVSDVTGVLPVTMFTEDTEKLFRAPASEIFRIKHTDSTTTFAKIEERLRTNTFMIEVSPKTSLSRNNVLQWGLRKIALLDSGDVKDPKNDGNDEVIESTDGGIHGTDQVQESSDPNMSPGQLLKIMQAVDKIKTPMTPIIMKVAAEYAGKVNPGTP